MTIHARATLIAIAGLCVMGPESDAQSVQKFSLQGSGSMLHATSRDPSYNPRNRFAYEVQLRYTFGRLSLGAGFQRDGFYPDNTKLLSLVFLEPRYVAVVRGGIAGYLAGRAGLGTLMCRVGACSTPQTGDLSYGGGLGVLIRLNGRMSADLGAQFMQVTSVRSSAYLAVRAGLGIGL
jgi:hypothetical protein